MEELNTEIDGLLLHDEESGRLSGRVCLLCDKLVRRRDWTAVTLKTISKYASYLEGDPTLPQGLRDTYRFKDCTLKSGTKLTNCLLSPRSRAFYSAKDRKKRTPKVVCCKECKSGLTEKKLKAGTLPRYAISNGMAIGTAPDCLTRLNEVELALVSQARFRGHMFTFWGGCHRSIKGWHSFYEVDAGHTAAVLEKVSALTETDNIAVILTGPFTPAQKEKVMRKTQVNVPYVKEALQWLKENNRLYGDMDEPKIGTPTIIDNSEQVESENSDIEITEEIKVVFPDGTVTTGGCTSQEEFEKAVAELRSNCSTSVPFLTARP